MHPLCNIYRCWFWVQVAVSERNHGVNPCVRDLTVLDFMKTILEVEPQAGLLPPVTCQKTDTIGQVINTLASKNLYRIYLVDETTRLLGVITLRDIIGCFVSEPVGYFDNYFGGAFEDLFLSSG